jgi:hypothetical protein
MIESGEGSRRKRASIPAGMLEGIHHWRVAVRCNINVRNSGARKRDMARFVAAHDAENVGLRAFSWHNQELARLFAQEKCRRLCIL